MNLTKLSALLLPLSFFAIQAQAQISGTCNLSSLNGTYPYLLSGTVKNGNGATVSYEELGKLSLDGKGGLSGSSTTSTAGVIGQTTFTGGTYSVQSNCSGTGTWTANSLTTTFSFQIVNGGSLALVLVTVANNVVDGRFYRPANVTGALCGAGTVSGTYGVLLGGNTYAGGVSTRYDLEGQVAFDGKGGLSFNAGMVNQGASGATPLTGAGTYSISSDCSGTAQIVTANGALNYVVARVEGGAVIILEADTNTTVTGTANPQDIQQILPQFVFGGGWYSALYFTNSNSSSVSFTVTFTDDSGNPMTVPGVNGQVTLAAHATVALEAQNTGPLTQGYATVTLPAGVTGYGVFRQIVPGRPDQEAVVLLRNASSTFSTLTWDEIGSTTSVAIVNTSAVATTVNITVYDQAGRLVGPSSVALQPYAKTENALRSLLGFSGIVGLRGTAQFSVSTGSIAVLGLRFGASAFTSIPATQQ
jgi:hypothetical protein